MFKQIREDIATIRERDPAAQSDFEVFWLYNGYKALRAHRRAHRLYQKGHTLLARWVSQRLVRRTGIEIHPAATIGKRFFIDHGTGVVIGETTEIGDNCTIYQGVTLGGTGKETGKRHPTLMNNVIVGAGAKVLGPFTVGEGAKIAANAVVLNAIPEYSTAVGVPARVVRQHGKKIVPAEKLDQVHIPDPVSQEICKLYMEIDRLKAELNEIKQTSDKGAPEK